jgi:FAD/FMN-containing dehydrogenase
MDRRRFLQGAAALVPLLAAGAPLDGAAAGTAPAATLPRFRRVRPGDPGWPKPAAWKALAAKLDGRLLELASPLATCRDAKASSACAELFRNLKNPYFIGDDPALTQTSGWAGAWTSSPSVYAVAARSAADVAAAVDFARNHDLRLVVKGGGHSYQGTSNAPDSLLVWTRPMDAVELHDAFVPAGCAGEVAPRPAVSVGAGCIWMRVYDAVTTRGGRYVQGGGCATVGVAGLVQSGGFGSFSKRYGLAAASLLEAEVVTADGAVRIANACRQPELFWGLKGGGGGSLGVVTRLTLATHELPATFGGVLFTVRATGDAAYRRLVDRFVGFYRERLFEPRWGEQAVFRGGDTLAVSMVFQGLSEAEARAVWQPFLDFLAAAPAQYRVSAEPRFVAVPARRFWDPTLLATLPGIVLRDERAGAPAGNVFWSGNLGEAGQYLHAYQSLWLPQALLDGPGRHRLVDALVAASRAWGVGLHFNKGLAGAPAAALAAARDTATNPAVLDAFALAIAGAEGPPAFPGLRGHEPDAARAARDAAAVTAAMDPLRALVPVPATYLSESDFFDDAWRQAYWGPNLARLEAVKRQYDPTGLFFVHHGVGSEGWSADGFERLAPV